MNRRCYPTGTRIDGLLGGGLFSGKALLVTGPVGSGKSVLALKFLSEGISRGERCLFLSFTSVPLSSTILEASRHADLAPLLSSEEPIFAQAFSEASLKDLPRILKGIDRAVLDHPEALGHFGVADWPSRIVDVLATMRRAGTGIMVTSCREGSPLVHMCDGLLELGSAGGAMGATLRRWPYSDTSSTAGTEARGWTI